ncbi:DNA primase [Achromobacter phage Motura]|uniref:DNA primase n=1 Tax=Achromobacter phage Motura TaxID=2591403 RepID=A0A514CSG7_9CAUD|nr:DNA primase [Achromobacter phage Motura]QDH83421.1 DNA primase [Achromobacter phage Motura]
MSDYLDRQDKLAFVLDQMRQYSGEAKRLSGSTMILCPFHADATPSCRIFHGSDTKYPGAFKCYGCPEGGGWNKIAEHIGLQPYKPGKPTTKYALGINLALEDDEPIDDAYFTTELPKGKKWRSIPTNFLRKVGCKFYHSEKYNTKYLFMPVIVNGEMKGFVRGRLRKEEGKPSYLNSKTAWTATYGFFPFDFAIKRAKKYKRIVLVEGQRDALRLLMMGIPAVAILGSQSWTEYKAQLLELYGIEECVLLFDGDPAGIKATKTALTFLKPHYKCTVIKLWKLEGSPYHEYKQIKSKKKRKAFKSKLWDPGNCPEWILDRIKEKYFASSA